MTEDEITAMVTLVRDNLARINEDKHVAKKERDDIDNRLRGIEVKFERFEEKSMNFQQMVSEKIDSIIISFDKKLDSIGKTFKDEFKTLLEKISENKKAKLAIVLAIIGTLASPAVLKLLDVIIK